VHQELYMNIDSYIIHY